MVDEEEAPESARINASATRIVTVLFSILAAAFLAFFIWQWWQNSRRHPEADPFEAAASLQAAPQAASQTQPAATPDATERPLGLSLSLNDAAIAHRGDRAFVTGGWHAKDYRASWIAEMFDRGELIARVPSLPELMTIGRALWLDDDRVVVKGASYPSGSNIPGMDDHQLGASTSGLLAVFHVGERRWQRLDADSALTDGRLAGRRAEQIILIADNGRAWSVSVDDAKASSLPRQISMRMFGVSQVLDDGRVIVAGGVSQEDIFDAIDVDCADPECPPVPFARGELKPSTRYETLVPEARRWSVSAASRGAGSSAIIRNDGRVVKLGVIVTKLEDGDSDDAGTSGEWLLEESSPDGTSWHELSLPKELEPAAHCAPDDPTTCALASGQDPSGATLLFLKRSYRDSSGRNVLVDLWMLDTRSNEWKVVATAIPRAELNNARVLPLAVKERETLNGAMFGSEPVQLWLQAAE